MDYALARKVILDCFKVSRIAYGKADVLTVAHDCDRHLLYRGKYYSPLIDTIEDDLSKVGIRCISIARLMSNYKGELAYGNVYSPEGAFARALVQKRLLGALFRHRYPYSRMEETVWGEILDETKARKVVAVLPSRELCVACKKRGVWVTDVQHGVIADSHPWYGERFRRDDPRDQVPNAFLCWDPGSEEVIGRWAPEKGAKIFVTGNRWVARFLRRRPDDHVVNELFSAYHAKRINPEGKPSILVTLAWGAVNIPNGIMVDELRDVIRSTADRYHWFVRVHPNALNGFAKHEGRAFPSYYHSNLEGLVEWETATRSALPLILSQCNLHISWGSSTSIEAAQLGIRSALLDPYLRTPAKWGDYYGYYRRVGMIQFLEVAESEILRWIEANIGTKRPPEDFDRYDAAYRDVIDFVAR